ncbi:hypothetical protein JSR06_00565 [Candidatus Vidania fulgoroideae]|uniref:Uncharacterized protein n=1 Tax=Candidatus Vidania fulgoroideorum TaxID=881286 RepID=A0A974X7T4_9PROT|nr:hypothetical protein JSR06_00565 [Candidatus Vidania fulgoroideae]
MDCEGLFYRVAYKKGIIDKETLTTLRLFYIEYTKNSFNPYEYFIYQLCIIKKFNLNVRKNFISFLIKSIIKVNVNKIIFSKLISRSNVIVSTSSISFISSIVVKALIHKSYLICTNANNINIGYDFINYSYSKVSNLMALLKKNYPKDYIIEFFTDSINDLPLLLKSNIRWIVNPSCYFLGKTTLLENRVVLFSKRTVLI